MADIVAVKRACGATINDVALAIATGAVRQELVARGALHRGDPEPRALVPIGIQDSAAVMFGNRFSITTVALPVDLDDPLERVRVIHARARGQLRSPIQSLMPYLFSIADVVPPNALRALVPRVLSVQPFVDLAVSNIPGSRTPLFLRGSRMLGLSPFINVVGNIALIIGVLSYVDELGIGITVDPDVIGDPQPFLTRFRTAATELADAVR